MRLRINNGLEFYNKEFDQLCAKNGIVRYITVRSTLQQNSVAETMTRTLLERVRCMLISAKMCKAFWGEGVVIAVYLINRNTFGAVVED